MALANRTKRVWLVACAVSIPLAALLFWPSYSYDITKVHPSLRNLRQPYQQVWVTTVLDGGSVAIRIIDAENHRLECSIPVSTTEGEPDFSRLFIGATHPTRTGAVEVAYSKDTKLMLIEIIEEQGQPRDMSGGVLCKLRGKPVDYQRVWFGIASRWIGASERDIL